VHDSDDTRTDQTTDTRTEPRTDTLADPTTDTRTEPTTDRPPDGSSLSRRAVLAGVGAAGLAGCLSGGDSGPERHGWIEVGSPVGDPLYDVVVSAEGPFAVGGDGRIVSREDDDWTTVVADGPGGDANALEAAAITDDDRRVWIAGSSGALGHYDVVEGELTDLSAPNGKTSSWAAVAVGGRAGSETVYLANSSGELLGGEVREGEVDWGDVTKPSGGESIAAVAVGDGRAFVADTAGGVYSRVQGAWQTVGIDGADVGLTDLAAVDEDLVNATADDGSIYVYNGFNWLALDTGEAALHAIDRLRDRGLAAGVGGAVYLLTEDRWHAEDVPTSTTLHGCALGRDAYSDVVVGANGTILERFG
jgi:hypothetical protein